MTWGFFAAYSCKQMCAFSSETEALGTNLKTQWYSFSTGLS